MRTRELPYGATTIISLVGQGGSPLDVDVEVGGEARLVTANATGAVLVQAGDHALPVQGEQPADQDALDTVMDTPGARIAWVTRVDRGTSITLQVHRFAHAVQWDHKIGIGVDERTLQAAIRVMHGKLSVNRMRKWLWEQFVLPPQPGMDGARLRVLASARPQNAVSAADKGYVLYGKSFRAHIENRDGRLSVKRLVRPRRGRQDTVALTVIEADVEFIDATYAATIRQEYSAEFAELLSTGQQYLNHWDDYSNRERQQIVERAQAIGFVEYTTTRQVAADTWEFQLDPVGGKGFLDRLTAEHTDLEASSRPPRDVVSGELQVDGSGPTSEFSGSIMRINTPNRWIVLRVPEWKDPEPPPAHGCLHMSLVGDRQRLKRQWLARTKIAEMKTPMPHLGLLLEGRLVPPSRTPSREIRPEELSAFAPYRDVLTERQTDAVRIALNTPDIALIQGPPGTGKTSVITAIEECLVQLGKNAGNVGRSVLLTSFQNEAVDEVARRTKVLGLPAVKISARHREGDDRGVKAWCAKVAGEVRHGLDDEGRLRRVARTVEALVISYGKHPPAPDRTVELLTEIDRLAGPHLPAELRARLAGARSGFAAANQPRLPLDDLEPLRRAVSGIRVDPVAFADDGPHMAGKALLRLEPLDRLTDEEHKVLSDAANWETGEPLPCFEQLGRLRDRLLDLAAPVSPPIQAAPDDELIGLFGDVVRAIRQRLETSGEGVAAALEAFLEELEHDPDALAESIRDFTAVLAATCQQSSSQTMADQFRDHIMFETVIVDEAARANPLDLMIPLCLATRRIILVGDHRQLPHILEPDIQRDLESSAEDDVLAALRQSMFERLFLYLRAGRTEKGLVKREITLDRQFRMHPVLGSFVSRAFYAEDTSLDSAEETAELHHKIDRYGRAVAVWAHLGRREHGAETSGQSKSRQKEATWIAEELQRLSDEAPADTTFGVIAFYRAQVLAIWQELIKLDLATTVSSGDSVAAGRLAGRLQVGTVDAFQGKEFDVVLLSVTRSNDFPGGHAKAVRRKYGHLLLTNRLCVAMSRQKRLLIAVGDAEMFTREQTAGEVTGLVEFLALCEGEHGRVLRP